MLKVLHLTDLHFHCDENSNERGPRNALRRLLDAIERTCPDPDLAIITGDLSDDGSRASYRELARYLALLAPRVHWLPGNHDDPDMMTRCLEGPTLFGPGHARLGKWRFVFLDSRIAGRDEGRIGDGLAGIRGGSWAGETEYVCLCVHHPPVSPCSRPACRLVDAASAMDFIDNSPEVRMVLSGHLHATYDIDRCGTRHLIAPSTYMQYEHAHHQPTEDPPGCLFLRLHDSGAVDVEPIWAASGSSA